LNQVKPRSSLRSRHSSETSIDKAMSTNSDTKDTQAPIVALQRIWPEMKVGLFTGGRDRPYAVGLVKALMSQGLCLHVVGGDELECPEIRPNSRLNLINLHGRSRRNSSHLWKALRVFSYYAQLIPYAAVAKPKIFHTLWNGKFEYFDRTLLALYFKLLGKKIAFTAHNVNAGKRDSNDSLVNRLTLRIQYRLVDHIFVHTEQMKNELIQDFAVRAKNVTVIPFGINNAVPQTALTTSEAKRRLGVQERERTILFFGNIGPYKGLDHLVAAFQTLNKRNGEYRLVIAGKQRTDSEQYVNDIRNATAREVKQRRIIQRIEHIPDSEIELYFKAADVLVLPYTSVSQSGVLFLAQSFGLPVIATDVGSLRDDIVENETGFLCKPSDPADLARAIETYFESDLFEDLTNRRQKIREHAGRRHSWNVVGEMTRNVYAGLLRRKDGG
jgi:D-inositol-3-phosphate glycosyltransferase